MKTIQKVLDGYKDAFKPFKIELSTDLITEKRIAVIMSFNSFRTKSYIERDVKTFKEKILRSLVKMNNSYYEQVGIKKGIIEGRKNLARDFRDLLNFDEEVNELINDKID